MRRKENRMTTRRRRRVTRRHLLAKKVTDAEKTELKDMPAGAATKAARLVTRPRWTHKRVLMQKSSGAKEVYCQEGKRFGCRCLPPRARPKSHLLLPRRGFSNGGSRLINHGVCREWLIKAVPHAELVHVYGLDNRP